MARAGWFDPFESLAEFEHQVSDLLGDGRRFPGWWERRREEHPPVNIASVGDDVRVTAELPGMSLEDVDVSVSGQMLTIRGERRPDTNADEQDFDRRERRFGSFSRSVQLPAPVAAEKAQAHYVNGILDIRIPKAAAAKPRRVEIKSK